MKGLLAQAQAMRERWPGFEVTSGFGPRSLIWIGDLKGLERTFRVWIEYGLPIPGPHLAMFRQMPVVRILSPRLVPNWEARDEAPLPHVYFDLKDLTLSPLCLFDPERGEWGNGCLIAETTVPWTVDWLACYEGWEATGAWHGGGRHMAQEGRRYG